jgi:ankyrin repeat protein
MGEQVDLMNFLIDECQANFDTYDDVGNSVIHHAAMVGNLRAVDILANKGCKVDTKNNRDQTPYMIAAIANQPGVMDVLFKRKVNINAQDDKGNTTLHMAASLGLEKVTNNVLNAGCKVDMMNKDRKMPMDVATPQIKALLLSRTTK